MAFGESLSILMLGRIISGIGIGGSLPAIRRVVILTDNENLGANLGRLLSADVFGFAMGPAISAVLVGPYGLASPFLVVSAATAILLVISRTVPVAETVATTSTPQRLAVDLLTNRVVAGAVVLAAGAFLMIGAFDALWDVVHDDLGTADWIANLGITLFAIPLIILGPTRDASPRTTDRSGSAAPACSPALLHVHVRPAARRQLDLRLHHGPRPDRRPLHLRIRCRRRHGRARRTPAGAQGLIGAARPSPAASPPAPSAPSTKLGTHHLLHGRRHRHDRVRRRRHVAGKGFLAIQPPPRPRPRTPTRHRPAKGPVAAVTLPGGGVGVSCMRSPLGVDLHG